MTLRPLGKNGPAVSPIGFGAFKIGRNEKTKYDRAYALPDDAEVDRLVKGLIDLGINYFDTAPAYGLSEERLGRALRGRRDQVVLATKAGETFENGESRYDFSAQAITASVHRSLSRLDTGVLDVVLLHSDGRDKFILEESGAVPALMKLRESGLIRKIGLSGKTPQGALAALEWADVLMVEYHLEDRSHEEVIAEAARRGAGVVVKKAMASGRLNPAAALSFVLKNPHVCCAVVGSLSLDNMRGNLEIARSAAKISS